MKLSVTSVCIPDLDLAETCRLLSNLGYDGVEWRVRYAAEQSESYSVWGTHKSGLSPANLAERAEEVRTITEDHGLGVAAVASNLRADELDDIRLLAEGVARIGAIPVRIDPPKPYDRTAPYGEVFDLAVDAYGKALDILSEYGLRALVEIHGGRITVSASLAYRLVSNFPADRIGVIYDVNNMTKDGFETFRMGM